MWFCFWEKSCKHALDSLLENSSRFCHKPEMSFRASQREGNNNPLRHVFLHISQSQWNAYRQRAGSVPSFGLCVGGVGFMVLYYCVTGDWGGRDNPRLSRLYTSPRAACFSEGLHAIFVTRWWEWGCLEPSYWVNVPGGPVICVCIHLWYCRLYITLYMHVSCLATINNLQLHHVDT